jgi:hypothetical protein
MRALGQQKTQQRQAHPDKDDFAVFDFAGRSSDHQLR